MQGPAGLTATEFATGLVDAAALAFDSDGRMWVGTAAFEDDGTDAVYVVTGTDAEPVAVLSQQHTVLGLVWVGNELFVASAGRVDAYSNFDGTVFATTREVVTFADGVGEVNGLAVGPDGQLVLGISAPCDSCTPTIEYSASIVTFKPDGSDLGVVASDIRAAIGLAFYPGTDVLFATMNQRDELGDVTPGDWLAVVEGGQSWGFPECYGQGGTGCEDQPTPVAELDQHAAVSGVAIVTGQLGAEIGTAAIVAEWTKGALLSVDLDPAAPASASTAEPFLTGLKNPVAVSLGPDGALYVSDWTTGTIYRIAATAGS